MALDTVDLEPLTNVTINGLENRLLVLASTWKDGEVACRVLRSAEIACAICKDIAGLMAELERGAGTLLLAEEIITERALQLLEDFLLRQPPWSDIPILILTHHGASSPVLSQWGQRVGKATLLERPVRTAALISIVRSSLRGRQRQYLMRQSQHLLQESEQRFKLLFEHHPDGIFVRDLNGKMISSNKAMESMTGYSIDELQNTPLHTLLHPEDSEQVIACFTEAAQGSPKKFRAKAIRKDGSIIELEAAYLPLILDGEIKGVHGIARDVTQSRDYERRIEHLATHDGLTGLPNRHLLIDRMHHAIEHGRRTHKQTGILFMDLNRFKQINDSLGHDTGDLLLKEVSARLKKAVRETDTVARIGGDEFVVILDDLSSIETMSSVAHALLECVEKPIKLAGHELSISTSIGGSVYPKDGQDVATLLKHADLAMYEAKELGSGSFRFYDPEMNIKILERLLTESALQRALEKSEFVIYYQPQVCVIRKAIIGVEALVRWRHPVKGLIAPADFIPLAEEIGMIGVIGEWVLRTACAQNRAWQDAGFPFLKMSVNLSPQQLRSSLIGRTVQSALSDAGMEAKYLELEITETGLMQDIELSLETLVEIRETGVSISIDDFGTGYSSLSYIKRLPVNTLKIDKSFICDLANDRNDAAIVCATIAMAQHMDLNVVAEGVTAPEQVRFLAEHHCHEMQGYLFSRPLPADELEVLLKSGLPPGEDYMSHPSLPIQ
ncbi:MAG: putative bifunctional diguanylate cyclase/phosphodiesterase [Sulfuriferula sp.]